MVRAIICIACAVGAHGGLVHTLSLVGRRYKRNGRVLHSIMFQPYYLIGLGLALAAGVLFSFNLPGRFVALQVIVAVALLLADELMIFRAIRAVEAH